jgi:hypothetical protein
MALAVAPAIVTVVLVRFDKRHALSLIPERRVVERSKPTLLALILVCRGSDGNWTRCLLHVVELESEPPPHRRRSPGRFGMEQERSHDTTSSGRLLRGIRSVKVFPRSASVNEIAVVHVQNHDIVARTLVEEMVDSQVMKLRSIKPAGDGRRDEIIVPEINEGD